MPRVLLVMPGSTYRAPDFLRAARRLRAEVQVATDREQALAEQIPGGFLIVDLDDPETAARQIAGRAAATPFDAIVAVDDHGVVAAARAARLLGLPHNPPEAAAATRHKGTLRAALAADRLPQPRFRLVEAGEDPAEAVSEVGLPCVIKAVSLQGGRGVLRANDLEAARRAGHRIRAILEEVRRPPDEPLLVEQYVEGPELALEGLLRAGELEVLAIFDKPDPMVGPTFEETLLVTPSRLDPRTLARVREIASRATAALGLREGPIHAELRVPDGEPQLLEVASRSIGGLCSRALAFGLLGASLEELILRHALGRPVGDLTRAPAASGVLMLPVSGAGVLHEVRGREEATSVPGITGIEITAAPGTPVRPLPEGDRYLGFVFAAGGSPDDVEAALREAWARLEVVVEPA